MATKKARVKRGGRGVVKRSSSRKKTSKYSAPKKSSRGAALFKKVPKSRVITGGDSAFSPYAIRALRVFSAGVQRALKELAQHNIPAVVIENGKRVEAVPTKVGGKYVVVDTRASKSDDHVGHSRKRG
jgi:hypothetical protein